MGIIKTFARRMGGACLPEREEIETFGADGEEVICNLLCEHFDCVIRNVTVPHRDHYLEKDFLVIYKGALFVLEVKNWKGTVGVEGNRFYQNKPNGTHKTLTNPVDSTNRFLRVMKSFYDIECPVYGMVVFAEPDCVLDLPGEMEGVALLTYREVVPFIRSRSSSAKFAVPDPAQILRCTRLYGEGREFCKGILEDEFLECTNERGDRVRLDTTCLRYLTVEHRPLRMQDKLFVTYENGATGVFYNRDAVLIVGCLDGTFRKFSLHRIRHIVF